MKTYNINLILLLSFLIERCQNSTKKSEDDSFIVVNVQSDYPKKELILQDFLEIDYIPLETNPQFLTAANIQDIGDNHIITKNMGRTDGEIFIFSKEGKGVTTFNRLGQGGEEYTNILNIILDEKNNEIYVNNHYSKKIIVYDLNGNFKRSFNQAEMKLYDPIGNLSEDYLICHDDYFEFGKPDLKRNCFLVISKNDGSIIKEIEIPYEEKKSMVIIKHDANGKITNNWGIRNSHLIPYLNSWILIEPSADTIYQYSYNDDLKPFIVRTPSVQSMNPEVYLFPSILTERYYFMQVVEKKFNFGIDTDVPRRNLIYDKLENTIFEGVVYNNDFIDKTPINLWFEHRVLKVLNSDNIVFITRLETSDLVEAYNKGRLRGKLKEIAANLDEESNPVIMLAKYKK